MSWATPLTGLPHLSDEAVAAFADGVLSGSARTRAQSHMSGCAECSEAVVGQRAARAALRSALTPSLPSGLLERLRELPSTAELPTSHIAAALSADGQPLFAAFGATPAHEDDLIPADEPGFDPSPSGRLSSGRLSSGRLSSGRLSSGRLSLGRLSSGRSVLNGSAGQSVSAETGPGRAQAAPPPLAPTPAVDATTRSGRSPFGGAWLDGAGFGASFGGTPSGRSTFGDGAFGDASFGNGVFGDASFGDAPFGAVRSSGALLDASSPQPVPAPPRAAHPAASRPTSWIPSWPMHPAASRPMHPAASRRWASRRLGLSTVAAAAVAVGVLASTAASAGGVTPAGSEHPAVRQVSPAAPGGVSVPAPQAPHMNVVSFFANPVK